MMFMPISMFSATYKSETLPVVDANIVLHTRAFTREQSHRYQRKLRALPEWEARTILVAGRVCQQNRDTCFYADVSDLDYRYSGISNVATVVGFPDWMREIQERVQELVGETYNYCLLNRYKGGRQTIGWHADDERDLEPGSSIASVSFGVSRFFDIRRQEDHVDKLRTVLTDGSLLVMGPGTQTHYHHQVPQQAKILNTRFNLTFRWVKNKK